MANNYNYNPNGYNPYNTGNFYVQKMQNLQGIKEQTDKQIQELQNILQMQQMQQTYPQQPQINQTFQLSNPTNNTDFDAKYAESIDDVKNVIVYRNTLFINKDLNKLWYKDANGNTRTFDLSEIIEKDQKDIEIEKQNTEINDLKHQVQQLTYLVAQQNSIQQNNIQQSEPIVTDPKNNTIGKIEPVKKVVERKGK